VFLGGRDYNTAEQGRRELVRGQYQRPYRILPSHIRTSRRASTLRNSTAIDEDDDTEQTTRQLLYPLRKTC